MHHCLIQVVKIKSNISEGGKSNKSNISGVVP